MTILSHCHLSGLIKQLRPLDRSPRTTGLNLYDCAGAYASTGQADSGVEASGTADAQSSRVVFDQNQGHGVSLSSGGSAVTMGTLVSANGHTSPAGVYSKSYGCWSGRARPYAFWSLNHCDLPCHCYRTETFQQIIWDKTNPNEGSGPGGICSMFSANPILTKIIFSTRGQLLLHFLIPPHESDHTEH
jgi:hypothetical protein